MRSASDFEDIFWFARAQIFAALLSFGLLAGASGSAAAAVRIEGQVQVSGAPLANSTVTLWQASNGAARQLAQVKAGSDGRFESKAQSFRAGIAVRGIALDSKGNLWVASNLALDFPPPKIPDGVSIMRQFQLAGEHMIGAMREYPGKTTGAVNMIRPDGTQPAPMGFTGNGISVPWGVSIDGNDDVWVANFWGRGVVQMAGAEPKGNSQGRKPGDVMHVFTGDTIQMLTDVAVDPAGNIWAANNWDNPEAAVYGKVAHPISTLGGGTGLTIIYGVAAPVKTPLMGPVQAN